MLIRIKDRKVFPERKPMHLNYERAGNTCYEVKRSQYAKRKGVAATVAEEVIGHPEIL